jgi:peptide-methionine (S)-S-oxide reductase
MKTIYLGAGCFWCTEAVYKSLRGVSEVIPGYMGGTIPNPSYEVVCQGNTGHAEVVKVYYDEKEISTTVIVDIFFAIHDPTTPNRQGNDVGSQYRSIIFFTEEEQREVAQSVARVVQNNLPEGARIVTEIVSAGDFYAAEEYHQNYYHNNSRAPYCSVVIKPKLALLQREYGEKLH